MKVQDLSSFDTKPEMADSQVEGDIDVNDQLNADIQSNNDKENSPKRIILHSSWLWSALIIAVCHLGIMIFPLFLGNPMYLLILYIVSIIGTLDPYWTGPNILSLVLGVLVFIGGILFKNGD